MTEFNFCYWLMGYFELMAAGDNTVEMDEKQFRLVDEHLKLVIDRHYAFCTWLTGFFDCKKTSNPLNAKLSRQDCNEILQKLRVEFVEIIDKSYPSHLQTALNRSHFGKSDSTQLVMRC